MAWTSDDLAKLEAAIAQGAVRVRYADREVEYRSLAEMKDLRETMRRALGQAPKRGKKITYVISKGTDSCS